MTDQQAGASRRAVMGASMMRRIYVDMWSETDQALSLALAAGRSVDVDGQPGRLICRGLARVALGSDRERQLYAVYDVEVDP